MAALAPRPQLNMGSLSDPAELGRMLAASGYFQDATDAAQAAVKVLAGQELGIPPIASMTGVFIVKGRVTLGANLIAALIKRHPRYDLRVAELTNDRCEIVFLQEGEQIGSSAFTIEDARKAGIANGDNWRNYPRNMLFARAVSNGAKWFVPDVFAGAPIYTPDELGAETDPETGEVIEVGGRVIDRQTGEIQDSGGATATPAEGSVAPPETPPEPKPAPTPPTPPTATDAPQAPGNEPIDNAEFAKLLELLDALKAPESFRRMATMASGVEDLAQLTRAQARDIAEKAQARFGS